GAIREGRLREDLYYRLNVFTIEMPALREHRDDIPTLIDRFLERLARPGEKRAFSQECLNKLMNYSWPGNVRQLRNIVERALIVSDGPVIRIDDLPQEFRSIGGPTQSFEVRLGSSLDDVEKELMMRTIEFADGNKTRAAEILGISLKTLYNRLQRYDENGGSNRGQE
ncbi:MAG TPA: helix-turn-helix domain-containing protein, partial [Candidatus Binataceae bacterium]|nr:helix-turn-helix domain-containing protein [Candidatus Binataceae bacterium]